MSVDDELREIRREIARLSDLLDNLRQEDADCHGSAVGTTFKAGTTYPTAVGQWFAVQPVNITGNEAEGATATLIADAASKPILALCLGPNVPAQGKQVCYSLAPSGHHVFNY